ncbi:hypothetical protein SRB521_03037 [Intestinimonas butyriciproducens]|nr:hypothetical protein SRB521_03037 [Intestinimonas butyriciproducens]
MHTFYLCKRRANSGERAEKIRNPLGERRLSRMQKNGVQGQKKEKR